MLLLEGFGLGTLVGLPFGNKTGMAWEGEILNRNGERRHAFSRARPIEPVHDLCGFCRFSEILIRRECPPSFLDPRVESFRWLISATSSSNPLPPTNYYKNFQHYRTIPSHIPHSVLLDHNNSRQNVKPSNPYQFSSETPSRLPRRLGRLDHAKPTHKHTSNSRTPSLPLLHTIRTHILNIHLYGKLSQRILLLLLQRTLSLHFLLLHLYPTSPSIPIPPKKRPN